MAIKSKKVLVAMSGGVDSSVSAALLKKKGYDVIGVFMKFWSEDSADLSVLRNKCCTAESEKRARLVAKKLDIPFYALNFEKEFKEKIVDLFLKEQKAGKTPNPCVVCNKEIKFNLLFRKFPVGKNDFIATGHYAMIKNGRLFEAKDKNKDQSYFLWKLNKEILKKTIFPVGRYDKAEVKKMAKKFKLPFDGVSESQEICFINTDINSFLKKYLKTKTGNIADKEGNIIGRHKGVWFYTIGQRKGIGLAGGPYYVVDKDIKRNILIVSKKEEDLFKKELRFKEANWISGGEPDFPVKLEAKIRYRNKAMPCIVEKNKAIFLKPQKAITPGQSVVFYKGEKLLGGGIIL